MCLTEFCLPSNVRERRPGIVKKSLTKVELKRKPKRIIGIFGTNYKSWDLSEEELHINKKKHTSVFNKPALLRPFFDHILQ